jgi:hypothetical protein
MLLLALAMLLAAAAPVKVAGNKHRAASSASGPLLFVEFSVERGEVAVIGADQTVASLVELVELNHLMEGTNCSATPNDPWMRWSCATAGAPLSFWVVPSLAQAIMSPALGFQLLQSYSDSRGYTHHVFQQFQAE